TAGCFATQSWPFSWSDDGSKVYMHTTKRLTADDTDCESDLYEYRGGTVNLVHAGPSNTAIFGVSADGSRVFFTTGDALVAADTDTQRDVYMRDSSGYTL